MGVMPLAIIRRVANPHALFAWSHLGQPDRLAGGVGDGHCGEEHHVPDPHEQHVGPQPNERHPQPAHGEGAEHGIEGAGN